MFGKICIACAWARDRHREPSTKAGIGQIGIMVMLAIVIAMLAQQRGIDLAALIDTASRSLGGLVAAIGAAVGLYGAVAQVVTRDAPPEPPPPPPGDEPQ